MKENPIYKEELEKVFRYNAETNILERKWKSGAWRAVNISVSNSSNGYVQVGFIDRMILVHRLIYTLVNGDIPEGMEVDHIDNDKSNNNINNLQLLSRGDNKAKSCGGLKPRFRKRSQNYIVIEQVWFGENQHNFNFGRFKILSEAQEFCRAYRAQFGYGKPQYSARTRTPEHWRACMINFKNFYFGTQEKYT